MTNGEPVHTKTESDGPRRLRDRDLAERYGITPRTAGEWLRAMVAQGVIKKVRVMFCARWSVVDAWVEAGGVAVAPTRRRGGAVSK